MAKYCEIQHGIARQLEIRAKKQPCHCQINFYRRFEAAIPSRLA